jgi:transposase
MYIESVPNRNSPPAILLRESFREGKRVRKRTLANLSKWPPRLIDGLRVLLQGGVAVADPAEVFEILRSLPHGHVHATLGCLKSLGLPRLMDSRRSRKRDLVVALIVARIIDPRSKLATARGLCSQTQFHSLSEQLGIGSAGSQELYSAMDWLGQRQNRIEKKLARRHLGGSTLVLYDVTSTYFEGNRCPLVQRGYSRDGKKDKSQIVFGLLVTPEGCPVAIEAFSGNTADPSTLRSQIQKLRERFGLQHLVMVGDRGLITGARIQEELRPLQLDWITALRAPQIRKLVNRGDLQLSLFDEKDLAEIQSPDYPAERLIVCRNPLLAYRRASKREQLLQATQQELDKIVQATERPKRALAGKDKIALRVGKVLQRYKVGKHFQLEITEESFNYRRKQEAIEREAALDGIYVVRSSLTSQQMTASDLVRSYKGLSVVEQAFRSFKTVDLKVRPIYHRLEDRVRAHLFLCMLAYYVQWHMRQKLAPVLFQDEDKAAAEALRESVVQPARRSRRARDKAQLKRTEQGWPVHSFQTLLADLATITKNRVQAKLTGAEPFDQTTRPTAFQQHVLDLLGVKL